LRTARDAAAFEVDDEILVADDPPPGRIREVAIGPSQEGADAAHQLAQAERLGQVVVGAELEADDPVDLLLASGQEEHRHLRAAGTQAAEDLEAVHAGQADVEDDEVRGPLEPFAEAVLAGARDGHLVALLGEGIFDPTRHRVFVLDDQDRCGHRRPMVARPPRATMPAARPSPRGTMPDTRPTLTAHARTVTGKAVRQLRA